MATATRERLADYKVDLIDELKRAGSLKITGDYDLKSKRKSPYFVNLGDINSGVSTLTLSKAYAGAIAEKLNGKFDLIYGIPEKGVALAPAITVQLAEKHRIDSNWFFTRKEKKTHGEATGSAAEEIAASVVGKIPTSDSRILIVDDVLTTGGAKYESLELLKKLLGNANIVGLVIAVDRQEVGINGKSAIEDFTATTGIPVYPILKATDMLQYLEERIDEQKEPGSFITPARISNYLRVYGTADARGAVDVPRLSRNIIDMPRSIIPACDMSSIGDFERLVKDTHDLNGIGGYKIGFELGLTYGLPHIADVVRAYTNKSLIYDHQKAATDIPDTGNNFMKVLRKSGFDTVILFPQSGPETERAWIYRALDYELSVIVGGIMTHPAYRQSEGGFITDEGALEMYRIAATAGVRHVVVPGTKPDAIRLVKDTLTSEGVNAEFYTPGLGVGQGGKFDEVMDALGDSNWHVIIGRQFTNAPDKNYRKVAQESISQLIRA